MSAGASTLGPGDGAPPQTRPRAHARHRARVVLLTSAILLALMHYGMLVGRPLEGMSEAVLGVVAVDPPPPARAEGRVGAGRVVSALVVPGLVVRLVLGERLAITA